MIKKIFIYIGVLLAIIILWLITIDFSGGQFLSSNTIKLVSFILAPCIATLGSIALTYKCLPKFKLTSSIIALLISFIIAYPLFGAGMFMETILKMENYSHSPLIAMFISGSFLIYFFHKNKNRQS